jgi:CMP-N,N'-diacetyllegionaminic acid synthase
MKKFFSIIPARIGSKGLLKKNIIDLNGNPLIHYSICASKKSKYIEETFVSSDSLEILNLSKTYQVETIQRPKEISQDWSLSKDVVLHVLDTIDLKRFEYFILLQPTSPLRNADHIDEACLKILSNKADALISVKKSDSKILKTFYQNENGFLSPSFDINFSSMPRQQLPKVFEPNGAIYICRVSSFLENKSFVQERTDFLEMDDISSIDIDTEYDLIDAYLNMNSNQK